MQKMIISTIQGISIFIAIAVLFSFFVRYLHGRFDDLQAALFTAITLMAIGILMIVATSIYEKTDYRLFKGKLTKAEEAYIVLFDQGTKIKGGKGNSVITYEYEENDFTLKRVRVRIAYQISKETNADELKKKMIKESNDANSTITAHIEKKVEKAIKEISAEKLNKKELNIHLEKIEKEIMEKYHLAIQLKIK